MHNTLTKLHKIKGISLSMLKILTALNELGPMNVFTIEAETRLSDFSVRRLRAVAVNLGFIQRTEFSDRRQCVYELSPTMKGLMSDGIDGWIDTLIEGEIKEKNFIYGSHGSRLGEFLLLVNGEVYTRKIKNKLNGDNSVKHICGKWVKL